MWRFTVSFSLLFLFRVPADRLTILDHNDGRLSAGGMECGMCSEDHYFGESRCWDECESRGKLLGKVDSPCVSQSIEISFL
jgi:hypothetical protein